MRTVNRTGIRAQWRRRLALMWYYGWDCASGCIWHPRAIASVAAREALA